MHPGRIHPRAFETSQRLAVDERNGDLYNTWYDYRYGEYDIFVARSSDGGRTWTPARKVNPDTGTDHYFSAIDIGERHGPNVAISYNRTGRVPGESSSPPDGFGEDVATQLSDYVLSGGRGLATPYEASVLSPKFPAPDGVQGGFNGDYTGIAVDSKNVAYPIWSDTRNRVPDPAFDGASVDEDVFMAARHIPGSDR